MPKYDKPDTPNIIWGIDALVGDLTRPPNDYIQTGWTQVKPPYEYENYSMNKLYQGLAYYNQLGIPEWDSVTEYQAGKSYVQGSNNKAYRCVQTHVNRNPANAGNTAYWEALIITEQGINSIFANDLAVNGYQKLPGGLIIQWGRVDNVSDGSDTIVTFPLEFPTECLNITSSQYLPNSTTKSVVDNTPQLYNVSRTQFLLHSNDSGGVRGNMTHSWFATGY